MAADVIELDRVHVLDTARFDHLVDNHDVSVSRVNHDISYNDFFENYLVPNIPCVIERDISSKWPSRLLWTVSGKPNFKYLQEKYGYVQVPVADCGEKFYNAQKKSDSCLTDFLTYWKENISLRDKTTQPVLYMKDWHFARDFPTASAYSVPRMFGSDWLNEFLCERPQTSDQERDDYRFVYMGPKGSWTPLHADSLDSYSWSINVCGRKRWLLFPPGQERCLKHRSGRLAYDAEAPEVADPSEYPLSADVRGAISFEQGEGEAVFVPSGWHHQVWNEEDTISINHNWVNACNVVRAWFNLRTALSAVQREVDDCRDMDGWHQHCQTMLAALQGMDFAGFYALLEFISLRRLRQLGLDDADGCQPSVAAWTLGKRHAATDLSAVAQTLELALADPDFVRATGGQGHAEKLMKAINKALPLSQ